MDGEYQDTLKIDASLKEPNIELLLNKNRSFFNKILDFVDKRKRNIWGKDIEIKEKDSPWENNAVISKNAPKWNDIQKLTDELETPFLVINIESIKKKYLELSEEFPSIDIFYAIKANPGDKVIDSIKSLGANFDIASIYELDQVLKHNISPDKISYGNTIKKESDIKYAYNKGVRLFACDSESDLIKLHKNAPDSKVFFRILVDGSESADWPLSKKFGSSQEMTIQLIKKAQDIGIDPYGLSFHVGSQQNDVRQWDYALSKCADIFETVKDQHGIDLQMLNLGGGFPAHYVDSIPSIREYRDQIFESLENYFENGVPRVMLEPGRSLVAESGVIVSEVINVSKKNSEDKNSWVYIDVGKFGGLPETMTSPGEIKESIRYPIYADKNGRSQEVILAGPTCDSMDILYENSKATVPDDLESGDKLYICTAGAYTSSYSSISFNGFPPLRTVFLDDNKKQKHMTIGKRGLKTLARRATWLNNIF